MIDPKGGVLPCLHPSSTQEVFSFRGVAYQYQVLPFGLALSPRTFMKCVDAALGPLRLQGIRILNYINDWLILAQLEQLVVQHRDVVLTHELGLRLNAKKSVLSPSQRTTYLGVVWDSTTMQARLSPARINSILTAVARVKEGRSLTVKQFQQLLGLMAAVSNVITFGLLYMRPLQWWLRTKGFSPRGNPFCMIKGLVLGVPCRHVTLATDASLTGWGTVMSGHHAHGLWSGCHLTWHINITCAPTTHRWSHQILVWSKGKLLSLRAVHVPGHLNMGADILSRQGPRPGEWMLHPEVVKQIWRVFCQTQVDLFETRETSQCPLWYSLAHPAPLVQTWPICSAPGRSGESAKEQDPSYPSIPVRAEDLCPNPMKPDG
ncbi:hypothetical protein M9458_037225, partial [Cirrhinus mrigala]